MSKRYLFLLFLFFFSFLFISVASVSAQEEECEPITVDVVQRDAAGKFIPNLAFEIYVQVTDVDGRPKPGKLIKAGKIDPYQGRGTVKFTDESGSYALRAYDQNKTNGSFWFYDDINVSCGGSIEVQEYLSSIEVELRDPRGELIKNQEMAIYTQRYDANLNPIKEKQDLVGELDSSEEGSARLFVPGSADSLSGEGADHYVLELIGRDGGKFQKFDVLVDSAENTVLDYVLSELLIDLKDANSNPFPAGEKIYFYSQKLDSSGNAALGTLLKTMTTNDKGQARIQYPAGTYAARIIGNNGQNVDFFGLEILEGQENIVELNDNGTWQDARGACAEKSLFEIKTLGTDGSVLAGMNYELYVQTEDANGREAAGDSVLRGVTDANGNGASIFNPDSRLRYALKIYDQNKTVGAYWYMNEIAFVCGEDLKIERLLPAINIVFHRTDNSLVRNRKFSVYTQAEDADGKPIRKKEDLVSSSFSSSEEGARKVYVAPAHPSNESNNGYYVIEVAGDNDKIFTMYDVEVDPETDTMIDFVFSDYVVQLLQGNGQAMPGAEVSLYRQTKDASAKDAVGQLELKGVTDKNGYYSFSLPAGTYVAGIKDFAKKEVLFFHQSVADQRKTNRTLKLNMTRLSVLDARGRLLPESSIKIFALKEDEKGKYRRASQLSSVKTPASGYADLVLADGPYLFLTTVGKTEYGRTLYVEKGKLQEIKISQTAGSIVAPTDVYTLAKPLALADKLAGRILLQVEDMGQAWYVDVVSKKRFYLKDGPAAFTMMRKFGLGITNENLAKIPLGLDKRFNLNDYDGDGIPDKMEEAIGTDWRNRDTDNDRFDDYTEIMNNFDPRGAGGLKIDQALANKLKGRILIQVESKGEAWYLNPADGRRYYLADGATAFEIMRFLSLGITNENLDQISEGKL
jgi:hypothetical protein